MSDEWSIKTKEIPRIVLTTNAEKQITTLINKYPNLEWMAGMKGRYCDSNDEYIIEELYVPKQEMSQAYIEVADGAERDMAKEKLIGWIHSHNVMDSYQSGKDEHTSEMYEVNITVNNKFEYYATLTAMIKNGAKVLIKTNVVSESRAYVDNEWYNGIKDRFIEKKYKYETDEPDDNESERVRNIDIDEEWPYREDDYIDSKIESEYMAEKKRNGSIRGVF